MLNNQQRIAMYDSMHTNCISKMKSSLANNDRVKFWTLAQVDCRILKAKLKIN
jgi:hypothetical protein